MGDEEEGLASVDEIAGFLEQDQPLAAEGPEDVEDDQPTRSDLSGLLFADDEERADQEEGREKMRAAPSGAEETEPSVVEDLGLPGLSTVSEADREDVPADEQDTERAQFLESDTPSSEAEGGMASAQSSLDELLSSLESEYGGEASSESVSEELEDLLSEVPEESDVPPESISPVEAASESTLESDELLRILGEVADQEETEPPDAEAAEEEEDVDDPIVTVTLAEIYANQGLVEKAIQILEEALRQRPDDLRIRNRLQEIRDRADDGSRMDSSTEEE